MATAPKVVFGDEERKIICEALKVQEAVFRRAARSEKDEQIRKLREASADRVALLANAVATHPLEL